MRFYKVDADANIAGGGGEDGSCQGKDSCDWKMASHPMMYAVASLAGQGQWWQACTGDLDGKVRCQIRWVVLYVKFVLSSTILEPASALFRTAVRSAPEDTLEEDIPGALLHHVAL